MKVKYLGETDFLVLTHGKIYDVVSVEKSWYRIVDDSGEDYLYPPEAFEIVEQTQEDCVSAQSFFCYVFEGYTIYTAFTFRNHNKIKKAIDLFLKI